MKEELNMQGNDFNVRAEVYMPSVTFPLLNALAENQYHFYMRLHRRNDTQ